MFDFVFVSILGPLWSPKSSKMSQRCFPTSPLENDVSSFRFRVVFWQLLTPINPRKWASRLRAVLIFTYLPVRPFSDVKDPTVSNMRQKVPPKSTNICPTRHLRLIVFSALFSASMFDQTWPQNGTPPPKKVCKTTFWRFVRCSFSTYVFGDPEAPFWDHFGFILKPQGSILRSFWVTSCSPQGSNLESCGSYVCSFRFWPCYVFVRT